MTTSNVNNPPTSENQSRQFNPMLALQNATYLNEHLDEVTTFIAENLRIDAPLLYATIGLAEKTKSDIDSTLLEQVLQHPKNDYELEYATYYLVSMKKPEMETVLAILLDELLTEAKRSSVITNIIYALKLIDTESAKNTLRTLKEKYSVTIAKPEMAFAKQAFSETEEG